mgnify:CR=1 FL=1
MQRTPIRFLPTLFLLATIALASETEVAQRALETVDKNRDGKLDLAEYLPLDVQAKHHGAEHFEKGDADGDGFLDVTELAATLHKQTWFAILSEGTEACLARIDADKDGKLTVPEYRKTSRMGGHAEQHFKGADTNQDGFLDLSELTAHAEHRLAAAANPKKKRG